MTSTIILTLPRAWVLPGDSIARKRDRRRPSCGPALACSTTAFPTNLVLEAERLNGINQQQLIIPSPNFFPDIPSPSTLASLSTSVPTSYQIAPNLRAPYVLQSAVSLEQQVTKNATVSITYLRSHGVHQFLLDDINAPLPGTFPLGDPEVGLRPLGDSVGNLYQYDSVGLFTQNQLITNFNLRLSTKLSLFGYYTLSYADSDTTGNTPSVAMNPYNILESYGRASFDVRNRFFLAGTWNLPHRFSLSPFLVAASGAPFNVTVGQESVRDRSFQRPARLRPRRRHRSQYRGNIPWHFPNCATSRRSSHPIQLLSQVPRQFTLNLRLSKTFSFGKEAGTRANTGGGGGFGGGGGGRGAGGQRWRRWLWWPRNGRRWRTGRRHLWSREYQEPSATTSRSAPMHATS